jgi:transcription elongation factor Elf1
MNSARAEEEPVTLEEVMRVRRFECRMSRHTWRAVGAVDREDPGFFICDNCGRRLWVEAAQP